MLSALDSRNDAEAPSLEARIARLRARLKEVRKDPTRARAAAELEDDLRMLEDDLAKSKKDSLDAADRLAGRLEVELARKN